MSPPKPVAAGCALNMLSKKSCREDALGMSAESLSLPVTLFRIAVSAVIDGYVSANMLLKEHEFGVFKSEIITDLHQTAENILNCIHFPILHFSLDHSKEPKVTLTQVRRIR
jgi:hypothetical protein